MSKKSSLLKKVSSAAAILVTMLGLMGFTNGGVASVFAQDLTPTAEEPAAEETDSGTATAEPTEDEDVEITTEVTLDPTPTEEPLAEESLDESSPTEEPEVESASTEEPEVEITPEVTLEPLQDEEEKEAVESDVAAEVEALSESGAVLESSDGEEVSLASEEAEEVIANGDPYFFDDGTGDKYCYIANGTCDASCNFCNGDPGTTGTATSTPIQDAINASTGFTLTDDTIYVLAGTYEESVTISTSGLILYGDPGSPTLDGAGSDAPVLTSSTYGSGTGITINASDVTITGFFIYGFKYGIDVQNNSGADINNNSIFGLPSGGEAIRNAAGDTNDTYNIKFHKDEVGSSGYHNDCDSSSDCEKVEGGALGNVNSVGVGQTFNYDADVVIIKAGTEEFYFTPDSNDCDALVDTYCVTWNGDGTITIVRNLEGPDDKDISNIQFWLVNGDEPEEEKEVEGLNLTSMCWESDTVHKFRVRNPNDFSVDYTWSVYGGGDSGGGTAPPGDSFFYINGTIGSANTTIIKWLDENGVEQQKTKATNQNYCVQPELLTIDAFCTEQNESSQMQWVINNPNAFSVFVNWSLSDGQNGSGSMAPGNNLVTTSVFGTWTMNISWSGGDNSAQKTIESCEEVERFDLEIDPFCQEVDDVFMLAWAIVNPNDFDVDADWTLDGVPGSGTLSPGTTFIGYTPDGPSSHTMNLGWEFGETSLTSSEVCDPPDVPEDPDTPVTAFVPELLIPVTGQELSMAAVLPFGGALIVGLGLLVKGIYEKLNK